MGVSQPAWQLRAPKNHWETFYRASPVACSPHDSRLSNELSIFAYTTPSPPGRLTVIRWEEWCLCRREHCPVIRIPGANTHRLTRALESTSDARPRILHEADDSHNIGLTYRILRSRCGAWSVQTVETSYFEAKGPVRWIKAARNS